MVDIAIRIARGQRVGAARDRRVVDVGPLTGLLHDSPSMFLSYAVARQPGSDVTQGEVEAALPRLRETFGAEGKPLRFELVDEASPGLVAGLLACGARRTGTFPLLATSPDQVRYPDLPAGTRVVSVLDAEQQAQAHRVARAAFEEDLPELAVPTDPAAGGTVLVVHRDEPVAVASWTAVAEGVTEIVGVATVPEYRRRGFGRLATAHAVRAAAGGGATLTWLTPGDTGAHRLYRGLGFRHVGTAAHLVDGSAEI